MSHATDVLDEMIADPSINGQHVDVDHEFGGQCWDLVELFAERLDVPKQPWAIPLGPNGYASEAWTDFNGHMATYFDKVSAGQTQRGDILVYNGHGPYVEGHICIDNGNGTVFEENADPDGSPAHVASRASTYLLGGLRFKGGDMSKESLTHDEVAKICVGFTNLQPEVNQVFMNNVGLSLNEVLDNFSGYSEHRNLLLDAQAYRNGQSKTPTDVKPYDGPTLYVKK